MEFFFISLCFYHCFLGFVISIEFLYSVWNCFLTGILFFSYINSYRIYFIFLKIFLIHQSMSKCWSLFIKIFYCFILWSVVNFFSSYNTFFFYVLTVFLFYCFYPSSLIGLIVVIDIDLHSKKLYQVYLLNYRCISSTMEITVYPWTTWGLGTLTPYTVKHPCITFDSLKT